MTRWDEPRGSSRVNLLDAAARRRRRGRGVSGGIRNPVHAGGEGLPGRAVAGLGQAARRARRYGSGCLRRMPQGGWPARSCAGRSTRRVSRVPLRRRAPRGPARSRRGRRDSSPGRPKPRSTFKAFRGVRRRSRGSSTGPGPRPSCARRPTAVGTGRATWRGGPERVELLRLRFHEEMPIREIAQLWGLDAPSLHHEYARARQEFRSALRDVVALHDPGSPEDVDRECAQLLSLLE